ncbi:MAG: 50S ribosomal protein L16 [Patescibacteria group bacterium]|nr:50S ribosomal protein L16 [Patescibacteria group bacterium]
MLMPKKTKFRRHMVGAFIKGPAVRGSTVSFGKFALKAESSGILSVAQIEAARKAIAHHTKRSGKLWIRAFADKPITKKPNETRMGGGKGIVSHYGCVVRKGKIIFELAGVSEVLAREAFARASSKLAVKTRFILEN